jgi:hypothetical protein
LGVDQSVRVIYKKAAAIPTAAMRPAMGPLVAAAPVAGTTPVEYGMTPVPDGMAAPVPDG